MRPEAISGRYLRFCASVPERMIGNEPSALTAYMTPMPPHARDELLDDEAEVEDAAAVAAVLLRDPHAHQAGVGELLL